MIKVFKQVNFEGDPLLGFLAQIADLRNEAVDAGKGIQFNADVEFYCESSLEEIEHAIKTFVEPSTLVELEKMRKQAVELGLAEKFVGALECALNLIEEDEAGDSLH